MITRIHSNRAAGGITSRLFISEYPEAGWNRMPCVEAAHSPVTLHEYRLRYPGADASPTLTQSGLLATLLQQRTRRLTRRPSRGARLLLAISGIGKYLIESLDGLGLAHADRHPVSRGIFHNSSI